jgi:hypothetical protein
MLFVDIRRESAAVCLRISNDPHWPKLVLNRVRRNMLADGGSITLGASRHLSATDRSPSPANAQGKSGPKDAETPRASRIVPALVFA